MIDRLTHMLNNWVDESWYYNTYHDVKKSGLRAKYHFKEYGFVEGRIPNPYKFINSSLIKYLFLILHFCGLHIYKIDSNNYRESNFLQKIVLNIYIKYEYNFMSKFVKTKNKLYLTSWVGGGVSDILTCYINKDLKNHQCVVILRSLKNVTVSENPIFEIEVFYDSGIPSKKVTCVLPKIMLNYLQSTQDYFSEIDIHHLFGFEKMIDFVLENFDVKISFYFHDYYLLSQNWSFFRFIESNNYFETESNLAWAKNSRLFLLNKVERIVATSFYCFDFLSKLKGIPIDKLHFNYNPEESCIEELPVRIPKKKSKDIKILVLGNLGIYKGLEVLNCLIDKIDEKDIQNFIFYHIGGVSEGSLSNHFIKFGWLEKNERIGTIKAIDADLALVPAQCPETYSVIISDLLKLQIPVLASKVGAIPERLLNRKYSKLVDDYTNPDAWLENIIEFRDNQFNDAFIKLDYSDSQKDLILSKRNRF